MLEIELLESVLCRERSNTLNRRAFSDGSVAASSEGGDSSGAIEGGVESGMGINSGELDSRAEVYDVMEFAVRGGVWSIAVGLVTSE